MVSEGFPGDASGKESACQCRRHRRRKFDLWIRKIPGSWAYLNLYQSVQFSSVTQSCPTLCDPMNCSTPGLPVHHQLLESTQTHVHWVADAIQPSHPLSSPFTPSSIFPSIKVFSNESALCIRWPKYWSFSFSISPSNESPQEFLSSLRISSIQNHSEFKKSSQFCHFHHTIGFFYGAGQSSVLSMCLWLCTSSKSCGSQRTRRDLCLDMSSGQLLVILEEMPASFSPPASCVCVPYPERRAYTADWTTKVKPFQSWKQPGHPSVSAKK